MWSAAAGAAADGAGLRRLCADEGACAAFVEGFIAGHEQADFYSARRYSVLCLPSGTTVAEAVGVVRDYLAAHPEEHGDAGFLLLRALHDMWPMREATCRIGYDERLAPD